MKWILIFLCLPSFGQLPVLPFAPKGSSALACVAASFTVSSATNKATYLACSSVSITNTVDGSNLTNWFDLTSGNTLQSLPNVPFVPFSPPIYYLTKGPSGHPCVDLFYPPSGTAEKAMKSVSDFALAQPITYILAVSTTNQPVANQATTSRSAYFDSSGTGRNLAAVGVPSSGAGVWSAGSAVTPPTLNDTNWIVHTIVFDGASSVWFTNGSSHSRAIYVAGNPNTGGLGQMFLGTDNTGNSASWTKWFAILIYKGHMATNDMQTIESTLQTMGGF